MLTRRALAGVLAGAAALALAVPGSASAARGKLLLAGGQVVENPSGCINANIRPLILRNETDQTARVYDLADCRGRVSAVVPPGGRVTREFSSSVYVP